jgi:hypothetical protein
MKFINGILGQSVGLTLLPLLAIIRTKPESVIMPSWAGNELKAAMQYLGSLGVQFQLNVRALLNVA